MCFGRLIGAVTGLEVARGGAREWVEGQMDRHPENILPPAPGCFQCRVMKTFSEQQFCKQKC